MKVRLLGAMACFAALGLLATLTLDGLPRIAAWIFLGGLAVKTGIAAVAIAKNSPRRSD